MMSKKIFSAQDWENVPSEIQQIHTPSIVPIYNKVEEYVYYSHMPLIIYDFGKEELSVLRKRCIHILGYIVYSLIATCKSAGVEPRTRIEDILHKIPYYERDEKDMTELLPSNWVKSNQTCSE